MRYHAQITTMWFTNRREMKYSNISFDVYPYIDMLAVQRATVHRIVVLP